MMHKENRRIRVDHKTGEYYELNKLAPKYYQKVMEETTAIKNKISETFGQFAPKDKEVSVFYANEKPQENDNKMPIEMEKDRPQFFSRNLMQKAKPAPTSTSTTTVRPSGLS